jgi:hypothetical protein
MTIHAIETHYAGHRFRSRLEARWAVFFDTLDIKWQYEPQGFVIPRADGTGTPYLPDFLLPDCGTWIEVKGNDTDLDHRLMTDAALNLPDSTTDEQGPHLMILGPIPAPRDGDWGWLGLNRLWDENNQRTEVWDHWWGFGGYVKSGRPWVLTETSTCTPYVMDPGEHSWVEPAYDSSVPYPSRHAYKAARSARFEHGETPA